MHIIIHAADSTDKQIQKVQHLWVDSSLWIVYCQSHTLYIQVRHGNDTSYKNHRSDFQSNVIDFIPLFQSKHRFIAGVVSLFSLNIYIYIGTQAAANHLLLAILTEHNLAFLTNNMDGAQTK